MQWVEMNHIIEIWDMQWRWEVSKKIPSMHKKRENQNARDEREGAKKAQQRSQKKKTKQTNRQIGRPPV